MKAKDLFKLLSKFPKNAYIYIPTSWELSQEKCAGYLPLKSIIQPIPVKLLKNGILKEDNKEKQEKQVRNLADLALLSQGLLKGAELTSFINRSVELMNP